MREWFYPREYAVIFSAIPDFLKLLYMSGPKDPLCSLPNFDNSNLLIEQFFSCVVVYFFFSNNNYKNRSILNRTQISLPACIIFWNNKFSDIG